MKFETELQTDGSGLWSGVSKTIRTTHLECDISEPEEGEEPKFGDLYVYFDARNWNVQQDGLIYTDPKFLEMLKVALFTAGLTGIDVHYSEQGMQGDNYVSLDVGKEFITIWGDLPSELE